jgi:signal transduction histidine kinase/ligand-binding sensor domain-containing protein
LWVGSSWGLTRRLADGRTIHYAIDPVQGADHVRALVVDEDNRIWIGHATGVILFRPQPAGTSDLSSRIRLAPSRLPVGNLMPGDAVRFTIAEGLGRGGVYSLHRSSDRMVWIGTIDGLARFDGHRFESITRGGGAAGVLSLTEDREANLWAGTSDAGAAKLSTYGFSSFAEADGLGSSGVGALIPDPDGSLYVVTGGQSIHRLEGSQFSTVRPNVSEYAADTISFAIGLRDHTGEWWLPGDRGLFRFPNVAKLEDLAHVRPTAIYTVKDGLAGEDVYRLFEDSRGDIWIGRRIPSSLVLTRWERSTGTFHRYSAGDGLPGLSRIQAFAEDGSGGVWIAFRNGGLARYRNGRFRLFTHADGVPSGVITSLYLDPSGRLWVGSREGGARRIDAPADDRPRFVGYTTADGLSSNSITCITSDAAGRIFFGVPRGVDRLDTSAAQVRHFTTADGLIAGSPYAALRDRQGALWFATPRGLSRLIPQPDRPRQPPAVFIGGVRVAGESYPISDLGEREVQTLRLATHQNRLQIDFFGMTTSVDLRYQYRLEPADLNWSEPTNQRTVNYASLSPGQYRFLVRAVSLEHVASPEPAAVSFTIVPPLWQRWWFLTLLATGVAVLTHTIYRYRLLRALEFERMRTRIATDLHDDVGANLSQIAILSEVARAKVGGPNLGVDTPLSRIADLSRESVDAMSEIVWAIDPQQDRFTDLTTRMRRLANEMFPPRGIELQFRTSGDANIAVSADIRREVFLVFKEAINNILRHAACHKVEVSFRIDGPRLHLEISDDGKGFAHAGDGTGNGLRSMRHRASSMGGSIEISSEPGRGTRIRITVPCQPHVRITRKARVSDAAHPHD